ncbi:uncharacterized protein LOC116614561 isoform X2 [Nematostella vectensis]|nr:uncharacterized protein LOC116614561 isoform X2 [Nematostella vectensis]XP_048578046.1 uncharacterized protein LOC116614561 isoform X2 [Nematostella vectensis]
MGHWRLDGSDAGLRFVNSPTLIQGVFPDTRATHFDKDADCYAQIPHKIDLRGLSFTIAAWVKLSKDAVTRKSIISDWGSKKQFSFHVYETKLRIQRAAITSGHHVFFTTTTSLIIGSWHHVAVTWDQQMGFAKLYIDGLMDTEGSFDRSEEYNEAAAEAVIGDTEDPLYNQQFTGSIMDLYLFDEVKTNEDINDLRAPMDESMVFMYHQGNLTGHVMSSHAGFDRRICIVLCARTSTCASFNHQPTGGTCELSNATRGEYTGDFVALNDVHYYERLPFTLISMNKT